MTNLRIGVPKKHKKLLPAIQVLIWMHLLAFIVSCKNPADSEVNFSIFPDENFSPQEAWVKADSIDPIETQFNSGITRTKWWMATSFSNPSDSSRHLLLVLNNPHINQIQVFTQGSALPTMILGDYFPFTQRPFLDADLVIPIHIPAQSTSSYLVLMDKIGETFHIVPMLMDYPTFHQQKSKDILVMGWVLGWMSIIFLFALFFAAELKTWSGAIYAAYVLSISLWLSSHWGLTFQYIWPEHIEWVSIARPFFNLLTNVLILSLVVKFFPPVHTGMKTAIWIWSCVGFQGLMLMVLVLPFGVMEYTSSKIIFLQTTGMMSLLTSLLVLGYPFLQWRAKVPLAGYYLLGVAFLALFGMVLQLNQKILPMGLPQNLVDYGSAFGLMGETGIITAAFARRASLFKKDKERLTIEILEKEKQVADQIIQVQEEERNRLGRDLHDSIGGMLASLYIKTELLSESYPEGSLSELKGLIQQSIQEARSLSHNLTPHHLEEYGLESVLQLQIDLLRQKYPVEISFYYRVKPLMTKALQLVLYRISNELLLNIIKHAEAEEALLSISEQDGFILLVAEDNGKGMDPSFSNSGIGLKNIQERVAYLKGNFELESNTKGTSLTISIPLHA